MKNNPLLFGLLALVFAFGTSQTALAKKNFDKEMFSKALHENLPETIIKIGSDVNIPEGKDLNGDVVCVFGNIYLNGTVEGSLISVFGEVKANKGASVKGDTVLVFSTADQQFRSGKNIIEVSFMKDLIVKLVHFWLKSLFINLLIAGILFILMIWLIISRIAPKINLEAMSRTITTEPGKAFLYGILAAIGGYAAAFIFLLTIVASGISTLIGLFMGILWFIGWIIILMYLGDIINNLLRSKMSAFARFIVGLIAFIVISVIPIVGQLTVLVLGTIGLGSVIMQITDVSKRK